MSKTSYQITITTAQDGGKTTEAVHTLTANAAQPLRLAATAGALYTLTDLGTGKAPQQIHTRRRGKDLLVQMDEYRPGDSADLILENFYEQGPGSFIGQAEDELSYPFIPNTADTQHQIMALTDGASLTQVLGGAPFVAGAPLIGVAGVGAGALAGLGALGGVAGLGGGAAALAGAAVLGAAGGGGGGGGGNAGATTSAPAVQLEAGLRPADDTGTSSSDKLTNVTQPTVAGKTAPGNKIFVTLDNGPERPVPVDAAGNWTWTPDAALAPGERVVKIKAQDPKGVTREENLKLTVDTSPLSAELGNPASLTPALADGKLNIAEIGDGVPVTIKLNEEPSRDLAPDELTVTGGSIKPGSFRKISATEYAVSVLPPASPKSDTGVIEVSLKTNPSPALTDKAGNPLAPTTSKVFNYDNLAPTASITSNQQALETGGNSTLNSAESANGVTYTLSLSSVPNRALSASDLLVTGGALVAGSLTSVSAQVYTVRVQPTANTNNGQLQLNLQPATALSDQAGNPLVATTGPVVSYDTRAINATISSNRQALERGTDGVLNSVESGSGVLFTIDLDSEPGRNLLATDLLLDGGTLQTSSFTRVDPTRYTVVGQPLAATNAGVLKLRLQPATALTDPAGNPTAPASSEGINYDTKALGAVITSNYASLNKNNDLFLNIAELGAAQGLSFRITLDGAPSRDMRLSDLSVGSNNTLLSLVKNSATEYTAVVAPSDTNNSGTLRVNLIAAATEPLTDAAGNPLTPANSDSLAYDNRAPALALSASAASLSNANFQVSGQTSDADLSSLTASFLRQSGTPTRANSSAPWLFNLSPAGLDPLAEGYYTFKVTSTDTAGNSSLSQIVLRMDRGSLLADAWTTADPVSTTSNRNELFINRAGDQTFRGNGGSDTFVWLSRDAGRPGSPDVDTILDFTLGNNALGQADRLNIRDLLGGLPASAPIDKYLKLSAVSTGTGPQQQAPDSLQLAISSQGGFGAAAGDANATDQLIVLKGVLPTPLPSLSDLVDQGNLIWQTTVGSPLFG